MTTSLKALRLTHAALWIGLLAHSNSASAPQVRISPGESVQGVFTTRQTQEYTVEMRAGDRLRVHIRSVGETLSTTFRVSDPGGDVVERVNSPMLEHDLTSRTLSARGPYLIEVRNYRGVGDYIISVGRIDPNCGEILPGSRRP